MRATLRKPEILRGSPGFQDVIEKGKQHAGKILRSFHLERSVTGNQPALTAGFAVRRTVPRAVDRNRIRRLLRESFRKNKSKLLATSTSVSLSVVFMYAPQGSLPVRSVTYSHIESDMLKLMASIALTHRS